MTADFWKRISPSIILFLFFFSLYASTLSAQIQYGDEIEKYRVAQSIVDRHEFSFRPTAMRNQVGVEGRTYSIYELGQTLVEVPLYALGRVVNAWFPEPDVNWVGMLFVGLANPILTALTCVLLFQTSLWLGFQNRTALVLAMLFGLGTIALAYSKDFTREPLLGLLILLTVYALVRFRRALQARWLIAAGAAAGFLVFSKFIQGASVPFFVVYVLYVVVQSQRRVGAKPANALLAMARALVLFGLPAILFMFLQSLYALTRFGTIYGGIAGMRDNPISGILSMLSISRPDAVGRLVFLSVEKSVFVYSPPVILALVAWFAWARKKPSEALLCLGLVLAAVVTVLARYDGDGGDWWGPRYLVQITPLLILPLGALLETSNALARRVWTGLVVLLGGVGLLVNVSRVLVDGRDYLDITGNGVYFFGAVDFLRHGALDSLVLYLSPNGFPIQINPYGIVLAVIVVIMGGLIVMRLRQTGDQQPVSLRHGIALLALVLAVEFAALVIWVVAPYSQVLAGQANTRLVAAENFLADGRRCEATALYLMALDRGTTYQRQAVARWDTLLPRAPGNPISADDLLRNVQAPDNADVEKDVTTTIVSDGSLKISIPPETDGTVIANTDPLTVQPDTTYELSGWIRTLSIYGTGYADVTVFEDNGNWGNGRDTTITSMDETNGWQPFSTRLTTLPTTKRLFVKASLWKTYGTAWVDGIELARIDANAPRVALPLPPCAQQAH